MGFGSRGFQSFSCNYTAKSAVNGRCGTSGDKDCTTSTLTGTTTTTTTTSPPVINFTINSMTATQINYTINSIDNNGVSLPLPFNYPTYQDTTQSPSVQTTCSPIVNLLAQSGSNNYNISFNFPNPITTTTTTTATLSTQLPSGTYNVSLAYFNSPVCPNYFISNNSTAASSGYYTFTV